MNNIATLIRKNNSYCETFLNNFEKEINDLSDRFEKLLENTTIYELFYDYFDKFTKYEIVLSGLDAYKDHLLEKNGTSQSEINDISSKIYEYKYDLVNEIKFYGGVALYNMEFSIDDQTSLDLFDLKTLENMIDNIDYFVSITENLVNEINKQKLTDSTLEEAYYKTRAKKGADRCKLWLKERQEKAALNEEVYEETTLELKLTDFSYWIRRIRKKQKIKRLQNVGIYKTVGKKYKFVDDFQLRVYRDRIRRNEKYLKQKKLFKSDKTPVLNDDGQQVNLYDIAKKADKSKLARNYMIAKGIEKHAKNKGLEAIFITMTLDGKWHPNPKNGNTREYDPDFCPSKARDAISKLWQKYTTYLQRSIKLSYKLRAIEPHEDGTPHLHAIIFLEKDDIEKAKKQLELIATNPHQMKFVEIDQKKGSAISYIYQYLTMDFMADGDNRNVELVKCWATERNVRRFSVCGLKFGALSVWQKVYTTKLKVMKFQKWPKYVLKAKRYMNENKSYLAILHLGLFETSKNPYKRGILEYQDYETKYKETKKKPKCVVFYYNFRKVRSIDLKSVYIISNKIVILSTNDPSCSEKVLINDETEAKNVEIDTFEAIKNRIIKIIDTDIAK